MAGSFLILLVVCFFKNIEGDFIHPRTFKMANMMASGRKVILATMILVSIYNGINKISSSAQLDQIKVYFPIHYVYGWIAQYFKTHYTFDNGPFVPTMVIHSEERNTRYFIKIT